MEWRVLLSRVLEVIIHTELETEHLTGNYLLGRTKHRREDNIWVIEKTGNHFLMKLKN
jgi:hypothetical protein